MTIRKIDHKQLKTRTANTGDILQVAAADDLVYVDPNNIVVGALTAGDNIAIEANGLIVALAQAFTGNTDIVPEGANLYFTNTRTIDAVQSADDLILGNLIPKAGGVYDLGNSTVRWNRLYLEGNTLVLGNLFLKDVDGKLVVTDTEDGVTSNGLTTDVVLEGANLYFTNTRVAAYIDDNITTSNIVEGTRVYFTNARALAAVLDNISTSNVIEGSNLYFTNARAIGAFTAGSGVSIEANGLIQSTGEAAVFTGTTDGITEGTSNLYYTNARVEAFIESNITTSNIAEGANLYFSNDRAIGAFTGGDNITIEANGLIIGQPGYTDENAYANSQAWFSNVSLYSDENAYANSQIWFANITTSNVAEGFNLYFSNDRAIGALTGGDNITIEANGLIVGQPGYTDEDAYANSQVWFANVTTSNVAEGSNLYFTNTRAVEAFTAGDGIVIEANGLILSNAEATFNAVEVGDLTVTGNLTITGNATTIEANILQIDDPLIHLAANNETSDAVDIGFVGHYSPDAGTTRQHAGVFRKHNTDKFYIFSEYVDEGLDDGNLITNIDIANATFKLATVHANVFTGNVVGTVSDISNHDTDALVEGNANLYFTNTRAIDAFIAGDGITIEANGLIVGQPAYNDENAYANAQIWFANVTTSNIAEGSNLYFSNDRVEAFINDSVTTSNIVEGSNLYFSNVRAIEAVELAVTKLAVVNNSASSYRFDQYGAAVDNPDIYVNAGESIAFDLAVSGHPFVIRDAAGGSNVNTGLVHVADDGTITTDSSAQGNETGVLYWRVPWEFKGNTYVYQCTVHGGMVGNIVIKDPSAVTSVDFLNASNVIEDGNTTTGNVFFTNARALAAVIDNISTSNVTEGANLYFTNTRAIGSLTAGDNIVIEANGLIISSASGSFSGDTDDVPEGTANLYFTNTRAVGSLTAGSGINIDANGLITSTGGGGSFGVAYSEVESNVIVSESGVLAYDMGRTVADPEDVLVIVEGLVQIANVDYTVNSNTLTFTTEIHSNANIELRFFGLDAATNVATVASAAYDQANAAYEQANTGATGPILLNNTNITSNITIVSGQNGLAVGPLNIDANVSITIAPGQRFLIL
jgi:plastocyanin